MNRKVAIGCTVFFILAAVVVVAIGYYGPKLMKKGMSAVGDAMAESARLGKFEADWQPPSAQADAGWFPKEVGAWKLVSTEATPGIPKLNIERATQHAVYQSADASVEVDVIAANDLEKDALFKRAQDGLNTGGGSRMTTNFGNRVHVRINGTEHTRLWWVKGWLFIFRSRGEDSEKFMEELLGRMKAEG